MIKCIVCSIIVVVLLGTFYKLAYKVIDEGKITGVEIACLIIALLMLTFMLGMMVYAFVDLFWRF